MSDKEKLEIAIKALEDILNCMEDFEKFGADGLVVRNMTRASLALDELTK